MFVTTYCGIKSFRFLSDWSWRTRSEFLPQTNYWLERCGFYRTKSWRTQSDFHTDFLAYDKKNRSMCAGICLYICIRMATRFLSCDAPDRLRYDPTGNCRGSCHLTEIGTLAIRPLIKTSHYTILSLRRPAMPTPPTTPTSARYRVV